ncbi:ABC transporter permease [Adlercreutzia sp. R21]|uniref:Transport permease protein n=1 Tax=Adlercreutzia wanghongyangiae TaxID=3111451 RepID=A0ABU6IH34_9ACTN|nr:ABC transporter permease [Adlercreutzia sp. R21]MEC4175735.1 ABC transporter permease [Adlercreutzia sp. R7]MEC4183770.1 ABC transporter permease [Adlercreutzia sp. R21]
MSDVLPSSLKKNWFTISSLVSKDFKLKYRRSVLGVLWSVLNPLLMMCVLTAVFSAFFRFQIEYYPFYLILGNTLFSLAMDSATSAMTSIVDSSSLIKKVRIDKLIFPIEKVLFQLVNFAISLIAVAIVMIFLQIPPTFNLLLLPVLLFYVTIFSLGLGLLLASLAVFFRDVIHMWSVLRLAWMYATPLFYPVDILPDWMMTVELFNPMFHYVQYFRDIALWGITPGVSDNLICLAIAAVTFFVGLGVFRRLQRKFILYV